MTEEIGIIRQVLNGNSDSFELLVQRYQQPVVRMIRNITGDGQACEDIGQDVFFAAYRKLSSFDPASSKFSTWLFTIARNRSINWLKKKKPLNLSNLPENVDERSPYDGLLQKEFFARLDSALNNLAAKQRVAFVLAEFEELPYEEIAQIEGTTLGTVKSRINRAKKKLRIALKDSRGR